MTDLDEVLARLDALEAENGDLRRRLARLEPTSEGAAPSSSGAEAAGDGPTAGPSPALAALGRRSLLTKGLAAAGAAAAGATLLDAGPAAAANGQTMVAGGAMSASSSTILDGTGSSQNNEGVFVIRDNGWGDRNSGTAGIEVSGKNQRFSTGINVDSQAIGISILAENTGVFVDSGGRGMDVRSDGDGIVVTSTDIGVAANTTTPGNIAVRGWNTDTTSPNSRGVVAIGRVAMEANGTEYGGIFRASATGGTALSVGATNGTGLRASGKVFGVFAGSSTTNPTQAAVVASASAAGLAIEANTDTGQVMHGVSNSGGGVEVASPRWHLRLSNGATRNAPTADTIAHARGDIVETTAGDLWLCVTAGTPGTWRKIGGPSTAGAFHVLPRPARVYDSRVGTAPTGVGPKTPFTSNTTRTFDLKANGSGVPSGATAAMVTLLLVNAINGSGNLTIWANGAAKPSANTLVWGGSAGRFTATAVTALDTLARVQVNASARTDLVIDVVGYYR